MSWLLHFIAVWAVTTITFIILTKLPIGVESDSFGKSAQAALVFGVLNGLIGILFKIPLLGSLLWLLTLGKLLVNIVLFGLSAKLVDGFRLRWGVGSAFLGAFLLAIINSILLFVLKDILP